MKLFFSIAAILVMYSCNTYYSSAVLLKKQYQLKDTSIIIDSATNKQAYKFLPDTIECLTYGGITKKVKLSEGYKADLKYVFGSEFGDYYYITLNANQFYIKDSLLISLLPLERQNSSKDIGYLVLLNRIKKVTIYKPSSKSNAFSIKVAPLSLINSFDGYSFNLGLEQKIYQNWTFNAEGGPYLNYFSKGLSSNLKGYFFSAGIRLYTNPSGERKLHYISLDYRNKNQSFNWNDDIHVDQLVYNKDYRINVRSHYGTLKIGVLKLFNNNFLLDYYVGLGIKIKNSSSNLSGEEESGIFNKDEYSTFQKYKSRLGTFVAPDIMAGIKIGFCFK